MVALTGELGEPPGPDARPVAARRAARDRARRRRGRPRRADHVHGDPALRRSAASTCRRWSRRPPRSAPPRSRTAARSAATSPTPRRPATPCRSCSPLDATLVCGRSRGEREVPASEFWPAYRRTALAPDELLLRIRFPLLAGREMRFRKVGTRRAQSISKVVMALSYRDGRGAARLDGRPARARLGGARRRSARSATEAVLEGRPPDAGDRRSGRRDAGRRAPADRRRPLDRRLPPGRRGARPPPADPRGRRLVTAARAGAAPPIERPRPDLGRDLRGDRGARCSRARRASSAGSRSPGRSARSRRCSRGRREIAHAMPLAEQIELIDAHPRLGAPPASVSALSFVEQGYDRDAADARRPTTRDGAGPGGGRAGPAQRGLRGAVRVPLLRLRRRPVAGRAAPAAMAAALERRPTGRDRTAPRRRHRHRAGSRANSAGQRHRRRRRRDRARARTATARPRSAWCGSRRDPAGHRVRDLTVAIALEGDFERSHTDGDNSLVIATDTMKNTAYAFAKDHLDGALEDYGRALAEHFLEASRSTERPSTSAATTGPRSTWRALRRRDAFVRGGEGTRVATVAATPRRDDGRGRRRGPGRAEDHALGVQRASHAIGTRPWPRPTTG